MVLENISEIGSASMASLVETYNAVTEGAMVKRFADRHTAERRVDWALTLKNFRENATPERRAQVEEMAEMLKAKS